MSQINTEKEESLQQIMIRMPESVHRKFKVQCAQNRTSMQDVVMDAIRRYLAGGKGQNAARA